MGRLMSEKDKDNPRALSFVTRDPSAALKNFTDARIGLGRAGVSLPLKDWLSFKLDHARARDAVLAPFDPEAVSRELSENGLETLILKSRAKDKKEYLIRPDLGRRLSPESLSLLETKINDWNIKDPDVLVCVCDGLSATAVHAHAVEVAVKFLDLLKDGPHTRAPVIMVTGGRVAVADEVAEKFGAKVVI
ncbi:MAG: ethanolamine ammonia-lyase subunit EutC, partial [Deltaproteobacteria bacterium]|nr:ethanolamine ammonia-lyase subunit EutC [Deltaproteobacteria bacterium]